MQQAMHNDYCILELHVNVRRGSTIVVEYGLVRLHSLPIERHEALLKAR
jgi:hypothetical protein